jgi:hypothetical protein
MTQLNSRGHSPRTVTGTAIINLSGMCIAVSSASGAVTVLPAQRQPSTLARAKYVWTTKLTHKDRVAIFILLVALLNHDALTIIAGILFK